MRLSSDDGDPIPADAIFFVNRSSRTTSLPQRITISNLKLIVPAGGKDGYGIVVAGSMAFTYSAKPPPAGSNPAVVPLRL